MKKTKQNNGVTTDGLIKLSNLLWMNLEGWIISTQFYMDGEYDELYFSFRDINGDEIECKISVPIGSKNQEDYNVLVMGTGYIPIMMLLEYFNNFPITFNQYINLNNGKSRIKNIFDKN